MSQRADEMDRIRTFVELFRLLPVHRKLNDEKHVISSDYNIKNSEWPCTNDATRSLESNIEMLDVFDLQMSYISFRFIRKKASEVVFTFSV